MFVVSNWPVHVSFSLCWLAQGSSQCWQSIGGAKTGLPPACHRGLYHWMVRLYWYCKSEAPADSQVTVW